MSLAMAVGRQPDLLWSACVQFAVSAPPMFVVGWLVEGPWPVVEPVVATATMLYLAVVNSIIGLVLLALLVLSEGKFSPELLPWLLLLNPADIYRLINLSGFEGGNAMGVLSLGSELPVHAAVLWLCGPGSDAITGQAMLVLEGEQTVAGSPAADRHSPAGSAPRTSARPSPSSAPPPFPRRSAPRACTV